MKTQYKRSLWIQFIVILVFLSGMTIFSYYYTQNQIETKVQADTYQGLQMRQAYFLEHINEFDKTSPIRSFIYNAETKQIEIGHQTAESKVIIENFNVHLVEGIHQFSTPVNTYYYLVKPYEKSNTYVFTFLIDDFYAKSYRTIEDQIALNSLLILVAVMVALLLWILSVIVPLRRLHNDLIKDNEIQSVNRQDEIGMIQNTIQTYQHRIATQQRNQEEFIHNVSHDLKTPITVIKSYAEGIEMGLYPHKTAASSAQVISENADRLNEKVAQFLYLNRLEYLRENEERATINVNTIAKKVIEVMQVQTDSLYFECIEVGVFTIYGNEEQWRVLFENVLSNALRYAKTYIRIVFQANVFYIENDGPKIKDPELIFERFQKGTGGETGLGLVIAQKTAQIHDCEMYVTQIGNVRFIVRKLKNGMK